LTQVIFILFYGQLSENIKIEFNPLFSSNG